MLMDRMPNVAIYGTPGGVVLACQKEPSIRPCSHISNHKNGQDAVLYCMYIVHMSTKMFRGWCRHISWGNYRINSWKKINLEFEIANLLYPRYSIKLHYCCTVFHDLESDGDEDDEESEEEESPPPRQSIKQARQATSPKKAPSGGGRKVSHPPVSEMIPIAIRLVIIFNLFLSNKNKG